MLFYVCTSRQRYVIEAVRAQFPPALRARVRILGYEALARARRLSPGTWLFADTDRLTTAQAEHMAGVHAAVHAAGWPTLNHPTRSRHRHELLRLLHVRGINPYDVCLASEHRTPARYPVFLRRVTEHSGAETELLADPAALTAALEARDAAGVSRTDTLIVEFCPSADGDGVYRKYGAYCVAGEILPRHLLCGRHWHLKAAGSDPDPAHLAEERAYLEENPHREALRAIFALARIEYGRIDYALRDGAPVVFEINTHPAHALVPEGTGDPRRQAGRERFRARYLAALETLAAPLPGRPIPAPPVPGTRRRRGWLKRWRKALRKRDRR